eukprot:3616351-Amphidinium_carterae.3
MNCTWNKSLVLVLSCMDVNSTVQLAQSHGLVEVLAVVNTEQVPWTFCSNIPEILIDLGWLEECVCHEQIVGRGNRQEIQMSKQEAPKRISQMRSVNPSELGERPNKVRRASAEDADRLRELAQHLDRPMSLSDEEGIDMALAPILEIPGGSFEDKGNTHGVIWPWILEKRSLSRSAL